MAEQFTLLRRDITESMVTPGFLKNPNLSLTLRNLSTASINQIYYYLLDAIVTTPLTESDCIKISKDIEEVFDELNMILEPKDVLYIWLHIGDLSEKWIKLAVDREEYEVAANLKKVMLPE
jgi:hypothetical protein